MQYIARTHVCRTASNTLSVAYLKGMQPEPSPASIHAHTCLHNCTLHKEPCTTPLKSSLTKHPSPSVPAPGKSCARALSASRDGRTASHAGRTLSEARAPAIRREMAEPRTRRIPRPRPPQMKMAPDRRDPGPFETNARPPQVRDMDAPSARVPPGLPLEPVSAFCKSASWDWYWEIWDCSI